MSFEPFPVELKPVIEGVGGTAKRKHLEIEKSEKTGFSLLKRVRKRFSRSTSVSVSSPAYLSVSSPASVSVLALSMSLALPESRF